MDLVKKFYIIGKINGVENEIKFSINPLKKFVGNNLINKYLKELG